MSEKGEKDGKVDKEEIKAQEDGQELKDFFDLDDDELNNLDSLYLALSKTRSKEKRDISISDIFDYKGVQCVIIEYRTDFSEEYNISKSEYVRYNGYVKVTESKEGTIGKKYNQLTDSAEITFFGKMERLDEVSGYFVGFDTAHEWNFINPQTQSEEYVRKKIKQVADDFIEGDEIE